MELRTQGAGFLFSRENQILIFDGEWNPKREPQTRLAPISIKAQENIPFFYYILFADRSFIVLWYATLPQRTSDILCMRNASIKSYGDTSQSFLQHREGMFPISQPSTYHFMLSFRILPLRLPKEHMHVKLKMLEVACKVDLKLFYRKRRLLIFPRG